MLFSFSLQALPARGFPKTDLRGEHTENFASRGARLEISTARGRYAADEKINIRLTVHNEGYYPLTLYMHRNHHKNFTLIVRDRSGRSLPVLEDDYTAEQTADFRDTFHEKYTATNHGARAIVLKPGESMTRHVDLAKMVELGSLDDDLSRLNIKGYFYPNPGQSPGLFLESANSSIIFIDSTFERENREPLFNEQKLAIAPHEVVYLALSAEYKRNWPAFFKYISLHDIIRDYPEYARAFMRAQPERRTEVISEFRDYLMQEGLHRLIRFRVLENDNGMKRNAEVKVEAVREIDGFQREFSYVYYLTRVRDLWKITGVQSTVIQ